MLLLIFQLWCGHALGDFALQNEYVARAKNRNTDVGREIWFWPLSAHCLIHGGIVTYLTGSMWLGIAEAVSHFFIDFSKTEGWFGTGGRGDAVEQSLHYAIKLVWAFIAITYVTSLN